MVKEKEEGCVAVYSINVLDIPKTDHHGWGQAAVTDYQADEGDTEIDISPIFGGDNPLSRAIKHTLTQGVSPRRFMNIILIRDNDLAKLIDFDVDWENLIIKLKYPTPEEVLHIVIYYDSEYINNLDMELGNYKKRIQKK
jgi:hypothetical protein